MNYETLYTFVLASGTLALAPGPDNIYVLMQSVVYGKKNGYATAAGLVTGCLVHTTLLAFGVSILIKNDPDLFFTLKLLGVLYLFYLAYRAMGNRSSLDLSRAIGPKKGLWKLFKRGFLMNVLNPKVALFFLAFFPSFLFDKELNVVAQFYILGLLFMAVSFVIFGCIAFFSGTLGTYLSKNPKMIRMLK